MEHCQDLHSAFEGVVQALQILRPRSPLETRVSGALQCARTSTICRPYCIRVSHRSPHVYVYTGSAAVLSGLVAGCCIMHESFGHECFNSSFAFCKPAMAVVSHHPARTEGL